MSGNLKALPFGYAAAGCLAFSRFIVGLALCLTSGWGFAEGTPSPLRIGLTPAIVHDQDNFLADWRDYLQSKLGRPVEFVSRKNYREMMDLLKRKKLDFAWLSTYPYVYLEHFHYVRPVATPLYQGRPYYRAYLIVPASNRQTGSLRQLKNKVFAYTDPFSNTGYLFPRYRLQMVGESPDAFFRKTFFTWSHRDIVNAVALGLADGGALDNFVWDALAKSHPDLARQTRIVEKSPEYGFPPIIAQSSISQEDFAALQRVLLDMANDKEGGALLKRLALDGFIVPDPKLYGGVLQMMKAVGDL
ncbi:MAG: PhnD/SsuA/transferrin family substrate-binding protein [Sulfuricella sp.]|nr:PhnD/SsuA/transferrin family substrate-binding protein [Sulfuricella sp.]